jgi:AraC family transcriptional regulator
MNEFYEDKINRVIDYIQANLEADLSLEKLSEIACFSKFHFSRIFKKIMGEPLYHFIKRLRLEKSSWMLSANRGKSITEIAFMCGFATSSSFAKSFKKHFNMSATEWRNNSEAIHDKESTPIQIEPGKITILNDSTVWSYHVGDSIRNVIIEDIPQLKVAYIRNVGLYEGDEFLFRRLSDQLFHWAVLHEQINANTFTLNIYYDNPKITKAPNLRVMVAIPLLNSVKPSGSVGVTEIAGGKYALCRFWLKSDEFTEAWHWMSSVWLTNSGYEWDNREAFERCYREKSIDGVRFFDVDIGIPIKMK